MRTIGSHALAQSLHWLATYSYCTIFLTVSVGLRSFGASLRLCCITFAFYQVVYRGRTLHVWRLLDNRREIQDYEINDGRNSLHMPKDVKKVTNLTA
jgi:hypothetical protein